MFETATRLKIRYDYKGLISVEDLWDIPLTAIDSIFKKLNAEAKERKEESLLESRNNKDDVVDLKINILKHVVETRLKEKAEKENAKIKADRREKIKAILADKQDEALKNLSQEELMKLVEES